MVYGDFKDLAKTTAFDKVLHDKVFNIAKNTKYDMWICFIDLYFFIKSLLLLVQITFLVVLLKVKLCQTSNKLEELYKPISRKFEKRNVYSSFKEKFF